MPIDYEPGGSTMIRISFETKEALNALKNDRREAIGDVVKRLILDNRKLLAENNAYRKQMPTTILAPDQPCLMPITPTGITSLMPNPETEKPL